MHFHPDKLLIRSEKKLYPGTINERSPLVVLCYPNSYEVGMSSLAFHFLIGIFGSSRLRVERAFALPQIRRYKARTFEGGLDIGRASVILSTVSFEDDYANLVLLLKSAGIEVERSKRKAPIVIVGGGAVSANPSIASYFSDCLALGEFDEIGEFLSTTIEDHASGSLSKEKTLGIFSAHPSFLLPRDQGAAAGKKRLARTGKCYNPVSSEITTPFAHFADTVLIDINRACVSSCRFCMASYIYRPFRTAKTEGILETAERWKGKAKAIGLVGTAVTSHPDFRMICERIISLGFSIRLSSLRIEDLSMETLAFLSDIGVRSITLAPETMSDTLRTQIGKSASNDRIYEILDLIAKLSIKKIKLYFLYGIPGESDEDIAGIVLHVAAMRKRLQYKRLSLSMNYLIPKAWTPFQWAALEQKDLIEAKRKLMMNLARRELKVAPILASYNSIAVQAALSLGDAGLARALELSNNSKASLLRTWKIMGMEVDKIIHKEKEYNYQFPWDNVDAGMDRGKLYKEFSEVMRRNRQP